MEYPDDHGTIDAIIDTGFGFGGGGTETDVYEITLRGPSVFFADSCKCQESEFPELMADGQSTTVAGVSGYSHLAWGFEGDALDCKIESILDGSQARITAGRKTGSVTVTATSTNCIMKGVLALVCAENTCSSGDCSDFGNGETQNNSVDFRVGLGRDSYESIGGFITLKAAAPGPTLATPNALRTARLGRNVNWIWSGDALRQVKTPLGLVDIVTESAYKYALKFYYAADVGSVSHGLYTLSGSPTPLVTWTVEFPGGATDTDHVQITENRSGNSITHLYTWIAANNGWQLDRGNFIDRKIRYGSWNVGNTVRTETLQTYNSTNGSLVAVTTNVYQVYSWGEALIQQTIGQGSAAQSTTYTRDANGVLQQVDYPNGSWEKYTYDGNGRLANKYASYLNQAPTTTSSLCRLTQYDYTPLVGSDDGTVKPDRPRKTVEKLKDHVVGLSYAVYQPNLDIQIRCVTTNATWTTAGNLYTTNQYDAFDHLTNSVSPDGTLQVFEFITNSADTMLTNIVYAGQPNGSWTTVTDGTKTITVYGSIGELLCRTNLDIASGIVRSSESYTYTDSLKRSYTVTYLDGTSNSVNYACCGLDTTVDRDGVVTQYTLDNLKRQVAATRLSITTTNVFDAHGNLLKAIRIGSDGSQTVLRQAAYDLGGQVVWETNALNGVTGYTNIVDGSSQTVKTNTYPDGGTRIETYFRDGALASVIGTAGQPVRYVYDVEPDGATNRPYTKEIKLDASFADTSEWVKTYSDLVGRNYKTVYAAASGMPSTQSYYNDKGQLWKQMDPDSVITLYKYNPKGEQEFVVQAVASTTRGITSYSTLESSWNTISGASSPDRITQTTMTVLATGAPGNSRGVDLRRTERYVWKNGSGTGSLVSRNDVATTGNQTWSSAWKDASTEVTTTSVTAIDAPNHTRTLTASAPDGSQSVTVYLNGRLLSVTRKDNTANHNQVTQTTYAYDPQGRQYTATDARNGTTTYGYNNADSVTSVTTPAPGGLGQAPQTTLTHYNKSLQVTNVVQPDNTSATNEYFLTGLLKKTYGSRTYPVEYTYDYAGRMKTMKTWQTFASGIGAATTTWNYNQYRGWLDSKDYANASTGNPGTTGPDYTYTPGGRLKTRTWARTGTGGQRIVTTYKYGFDDTPTGNEHGDLTEVSYQNDPQSTPTVTYTYDRLGRQSTIVQGGMTTTKTYNDASEQLTEAFTGGTLAGLTVTSGYDNYLRRSSLSINTQPSSLNFSYAYDTASRLETVTDTTGSPTHSATYAYLANSPLVSTVTFKQGTTTRMTTTQSYDFLNRLTTIQALSSQPSTISSFSYTHNVANQRTRATLGDLSYWVYGYDSLGQVKSGKRYWFNGTPVAGQQFEYGFDDIGNRTQTKAGGDQNGANLRTNTYTANKLNQYSSRTVAGAVDVMGVALVGATVTVNGPTPAAYRKGEYFRKQLTVANSSAPVWQQVDVTATGETPVTRHELVPRTPEAFTPDADGNLLTDGRWTYTWDAENRLKQVESLASGPTASKRKVVWEFDAQGRRIRQTTYDGSSGSYVVTEDLKLVYDGWRCMAELNAANNTRLRSFIWGLDLSGSLDGAGGVGGLLMVNSVANGAHFYAYDGNGNVAALVKATDGTVSANYEYGPFGETIRATGMMAKENAFRFSTKRTDNTTDLVLYEYRLYNPNTGRWPNRDPINELGFKLLARSGGGFNRSEEENLFRFVSNNPINGFDPDGRSLMFPTGDLFAASGENCCNLLSGRRTRNQAVERGVRIGDATYGGNAYLHCVAACRANKACTGAKRFWDGRETPGTLDGDMDLANNAVGYGIQGDCWRGCADAWRNGSLTCIDVRGQLSPCRGNLPPGL